MSDLVVRAAGAVVWRRSDDGRLEVLLVHRPKYDDWTLPKGKAARDESDEDCAPHEVEEETGLRCPLGTELASTSYVDSKDRPKVVRYWAMEACEEPHAHETDEVDECRWISARDAQHVLSYDHDWPVVAELIDHLTRADR